MSRALGLAAALLAAAALFAPAAKAQDAANGALLYKTAQVAGKRSCANSACHGDLPGGAQNRIANGVDAARIQASIANQTQMAFLAGKLSNEQLNDLAAYIAQTLGGTPIYLPVAAKPKPQLDPAGINFGVQPLAIATPAQTVTLSNAASATAPLVLGTLALTTGSDFALAGGTCAAGQSLAPGASCTVAITFRPTLAGTRSGSLTITHNAGSSVLSLLGLGGSQTPVVSLSPSQLTFSQALGGTSGAQRVVVSNIGDARLVFEGLSITGASAAEYAIDPASTCSTGASVAAGANCSVDIRFTPAAAGGRDAALLLRHNAGLGTSTVALVGQASSAATPNMTLDATLVDLGTQAVGIAGTPRTLTVGNSGAAELVVSALTLRGLHSADIVMAGSCQAGTRVVPGASCTVTLALKPAAVGTRSATLELASNTPTGTATVSLQGEGVAVPAPIVALSRPALGFGRVTLATPTAARTVTLSNAGSAVLGISDIQSSSTEFTVMHDCPASLAAGARCTVGVSYQPAAAANAAERVLIRSNAFSSPNSIVLTGLGVTTVLPVLAWSETATELDFGSVAVGQSSNTLTYTLNNQGPGEVAVSSLALTGSAPEAYSIAGGSCSGGGVRLAQGASCTVLLQFVPEVAGPRKATLLVASEGSNPPELLLSGTGSASTTPTPTPTPNPTPTPTPTPGTPTTVSPFAADRATLDFRATVVRTGGRSDPLSLRITNRSTATATIRSASTSSGFVLDSHSATDACRGVPWTLPPGTSCTLAVSFAPSVGGASTGTLTITAEDASQLTVAMTAEARTEITNVGGGGAFALHWLLLLALAVALLARCPAHLHRGHSS